ncbi:hypothetical protein WH96_18820 [Kiloniella spongiae]|uniref:Calcineurin-like phosphoesterase domain-containing protein n=1 Tax=Kiloniella spongiae TaxID=1489064 RepID=A0A0H2MAJ0_9PROT|nr:phosphodiesterase [Kiloniella spongiae]KLN59196.1 hypothetical protein WH96_18820 [Kiloniella spongiae]
MKFIHLSDTHLLPKSETIIGIDACDRLEVAVESISRDFSDAAFCIITGDLTDRGDPQSYREFIRILDRLPIPWYALMGNHDERHVAKEELPDLPWCSDGYLYYEFATEVGQFVVLDSLVDMDTSYLSKEQLDWLDGCLARARAAQKSVYLFVHHVSFDIGIPWLDEQYNMNNGDELGAILKKHNNVRHLFCGHVHRPIHGSWQGIPFSTVRSTCHQVALKLTGEKVIFTDEPPSYAVVLLRDNRVVIHDHNFLGEQIEFPDY